MANQIEVALLNDGNSTFWVVYVEGVERKRFPGNEDGWERANECADELEAEGE